VLPVFNLSPPITNWNPIYKKSYARLMTVQDLGRSLAELMNCKRLTKNSKLNLWKTCKTNAKLRKNLQPDKCCHNSVTRGNYVILL